MANGDPRVDQYIANANDFAKPILTRIRETVRTACPDIEEAIKWSSPTFMYRGRILCGMAAFKEHCHLHFWRGQLIALENGADVNDLLRGLKRVSDLPSKRELAGYVKQAMQMHDAGVTPPKAKAARKEELVVPADLAAPLKRNKKAAQTFAKFSPSHRREYIEWITDAKRDDTRARRVAQTLEWLAEGKSRNWKYT